MTSVADANEQQRKKYGTIDNEYSDFPIGTPVQVICIAQDFSFFQGIETGTVIENDGTYLGIIVAFDKPFNTVRNTFNFEPKDLIALPPKPFDPTILRGGLYKIYWTAKAGGGTSLASVGRDNSGKVWLAPTNWVTVPTFDWSSVDHVEAIKL